MERRPYPIGLDGMPVATRELELKPSEIPDLRENKSLHHLHFDAPRYFDSVITDTVRDLKGEHELMQNDQHNVGRFCLHALYTAPEMATLRQYMDRLDLARQTGEKIERRVMGLGWLAMDITKGQWRQIEIEYNRHKE